ncbi:hypothetical protein KUCAC02_005935 [Chaenocephalus aceratus]|uniref:Uncharacterized protein n=1 Tax=Chaenocephalus aceratus TaxID=36190 RepID=A0ACB9WRK7_CHAAC|nr:hypothetical protein KUCAC02_005935 [Chaenocephalus aceratus]
MFSILDEDEKAAGSERQTTRKGSFVRKDAPLLHLRLPSVVCLGCRQGGTLACTNQTPSLCVLMLHGGPPSYCWLDILKPFATASRNSPLVIREDICYALSILRNFPSPCPSFLGSDNRSGHPYEVPA